MSQMDADVALFNTVQELLGEGQVAGGSERRRNRRQTYRCVQAMAPYDGTTLPSAGEFRQIECRDLSNQGFSFLSSEPPETEWIAVALGRPPFLLFSAEIVHIGDSTPRGGHRYKIGCRFIRRLNPRAPRN